MYLISNLLPLSYKLLIVGGGAGGCSMASKFASRLGKGNVAVIEPSEVKQNVFELKQYSKSLIMILSK